MPDDPTPHGGEAFHELPDRATIPEPKPGQRSDDTHGSVRRPDASDIAQRPELPTEAEIRSADIADADADSAADNRARANDGDTRELSVTQQPAV